MAFCTNCGAKIKGDTKFCPNCGASVEGTPQTPKGSSAPGPAPQGAAGSAAQGKALAMLKRNYKLIGIAVLAVVVLLLLFSRGTGGKGDNALAQFQGYWDRKGLVDSDVTIGMTRTPVPCQKRSTRTEPCTFRLSGTSLYRTWDKEPVCRTTPCG